MILAEPDAGRTDPGFLPQRIAALVPWSDGISGPARQLAALARGLREAGVDCLVVALHRPGGPPSALTRHLQDAGIPHCAVRDRGPADWRMALTVGRVLRHWRPAILQTHGYKATAVAYLLRRLHYPWPWIGFFHGVTTVNLRARCYHWVDRRLLGSAERVVVMSQAETRAFRHCRDRVRTIYNAALAPPPVDDVTERDIPSALSGPSRPIVGVVGRLSPEKGVDVFLEACALLARRGLAFSALVAGDGLERPRLEARSHRLGLAPHVRFLGHVDHVDAVYRRLDLLVLPSRSEGLPNTLLEAMRRNVPVVATAVGAVPEIVGSSPAALLVAPESASALATAMERALASGDSSEAAAARRDVVSRLSLERRVEAHLDLYRDVLEERRARETRTNRVIPECAGLPAR